MRVDIQDILNHLEYLRVVNSEDIMNLEFFYEGRSIPISDEKLEQWKYMGLNNTDFIREIELP